MAALRVPGYGLIISRACVKVELEVSAAEEVIDGHLALQHEKAICLCPKGQKMPPAGHGSRDLLVCLKSRS